MSGFEGWPVGVKPFHGLPNLDPRAWEDRVSTAGLVSALDRGWQINVVQVGAVGDANCAVNTVKS
jgi:hypothetical protein